MMLSVRSREGYNMSVWQQTDLKTSNSYAKIVFTMYITLTMLLKTDVCFLSFILIQSQFSVSHWTVYTWWAECFFKQQLIIACRADHTSCLHTNTGMCKLKHTTGIHCISGKTAEHATLTQTPRAPAHAKLCLLYFGWWHPSFITSVRN